MTPSPQPKAPEAMRSRAGSGWASMSRPINMDPGMQAGSIVQDLLMALGRIEQRLARIEEKLGIEAEKEAGGRAQRKGQRTRASTGRRTRRRVEKARPSPYQ